MREYINKLATLAEELTSPVVKELAKDEIAKVAGGMETHANISG